MSENSSTWYAVVNPHSGSGKTIRLWSKAKSILEGYKVPFMHEMTKCKGHAVEMVVRAASKGYRKFVAVGGDGTVHEVLNGIMRYLENNVTAKLSEFILAVIPIGSGNDWIKSHKVPNDARAAIDLIRKEKVMEQDVVKIEHLSRKELSEGVNPSQVSAEGRSNYMLNVGGTGFDCKVCEITNSLKDEGKRGRLLYFKSLITTIFNMKTTAVSVFADGAKFFEGHFISLAFGIGKYCGGGMRQCPYSTLDDGLLDMTIVPGRPLSWVLPRLLAVFTGNLPAVKGIFSGKFKKIEVVNSDPALTENMEADGEIVTSLPFRVSVMDQQLRVITNLAQ